MNRIIKNKERQKIAIALCAVFVIIVLANWWVSHSMTQVSSQFASVYHDRLVPALDLAAMQERYYQNRMLLEEHLEELTVVRTGSPVVTIHVIGRSGDDWAGVVTSSVETG